ncbi:hypothetical protein OBBRIDRAFT_605782 [Obba rivulosa]|uniref:Peptidase C14 caspase domain-containing protein n=1 Tax=Obba rivulosa TaxID=1052685 RepID=A0A8E2DNL8_9APHY|nr:hypothetical protein OBBRIDRAFT_605782 [Obba rivulosa]
MSPQHPGNHNSVSPSRKALCVAVQYSELANSYPDARLWSTFTDPELIRNLLIETYKWNSNDITVLKDDHGPPDKIPSRKNILREMKNLVSGAKKGDRFLFSFSGHGDQVPNTNGTEADNMDEVIWPSDVALHGDDWLAAKQQNYIIDDDIHRILVEHLPEGSSIVMIFDHCHSGTAADLPIEAEFDRASSTKTTSITTKHFVRGKSVVEVHTLEHDTKSGTRKRKSVRTQDTGKFHQALAMSDFQASVESWSACRDNELTFDTGSGGLLVRGFTETLTRRPNPTHGELLVALNHYLVDQAKGHTIIDKIHPELGMEVIIAGESYPNVILSY